MKMLGKLLHRVISGKKPLCATTISTHYHQSQCILMENPINLYTEGMLIGHHKILECLTVCIYVVVGCTSHLATIWSNLRKGKKNCRLIRENIPVYKLSIPTPHFHVSIKSFAKRLHLTQHRLETIP